MLLSPKKKLCNFDGIKFLFICDKTAHGRIVGVLIYVDIKCMEF